MIARMISLLSLACLLLPASCEAMYKIIETPPRLENGMVCSEAFLWLQFERRSTPTVAAARVQCDDLARNAAVHGRPRNWMPMRLKDTAAFFEAVRRRYDKTSAAKDFSFFAEASNLCFSINFKAYQLSAEGDFSYRGMNIKFRTSIGVECPLNEPEPSITHIACTAVNCTRPQKPPPTFVPSEGTQNPLELDRSRQRPCLLLGEDAVTMADFRETRLTYIIALVGCNLLSFGFLACAIHYCLKWRHIRRLYRMARSAGSLPGTTASPPPAVRHLGPASINGGGSATLGPYGGAYPDYHYSSIARRKAMMNQRPDDDMLSYRSDHTQLLMKHHGSLQRQMAPPSSLRHGAISPPRGWGPDAPSTPGSIRRNGSISQMSMTSAGHPRRNGSLPAPPHPPPPPPTNGSTFQDDRRMDGI